MDALMHHKLERCLQQLRSSSMVPKIRRSAERQLSKLLLQLVDAKIRHGLSHSDELRQLADAVLDPTLVLEGTGAILLDHFRYRLAHVAMRSRDWILAEQLLEAVLQGYGDLRLARIYQVLCSIKRRQLPLDDMALTSLVRHLVAPEQSSGPIPLDLAVQDLVTNMAELFLLLQDAPEHVLDGLYDSSQGDPLARGLTAGLTVLLVPKEGEHRELNMGEWLALRQVKELEEEGWLVVDSMAPRGEIGRGSQAKPRKGEPNQKDLCALLQELAKAAPTPLNLATLRASFKADPDLVKESGSDNDSEPCSGNPVPLERATKAWLGNPTRLVIDNTDRRWTLVPPYAVIRSDARRDWHQSVPSSQ